MWVFCTKYQVQCTKINKSLVSSKRYSTLLQQAVFMSYGESLHCTSFLVLCTINIRRSAFDICFQSVSRTSYFYLTSAGRPDRRGGYFVSLALFSTWYLVLGTLFNYFSNSYTPATPCPPPTQAVTSPYFLFWRRSSLKSCMESFAPVHPSG